jgi:hypothetical protein
MLVFGDSPEKQVKECATMNEPMGLIQQLSNWVTQIFTASLPRQQTVYTSFSNRTGHKRKATGDPEELKARRVPRTLWQPCVSNRMFQNSPFRVLQSKRQFNGKKITSDNPEKQVKKHATHNCNLPTTITGKYEPVVLIQQP